MSALLVDEEGREGKRGRGGGTWRTRSPRSVIEPACVACVFARPPMFRMWLVNSEFSSGVMN